MKTLLKLFDTIVLDSSECHLHYYDFKHSLKFFLNNLEGGGHRMKLISHKFKHLQD